MADAGSIDYYMRMIVTHGFSTSSENYLVEFGNLEYTRGYAEALAEAAANATAVVEGDAEVVAVKGSKKK